MKNLLIDIGNSDIKIATAVSGSKSVKFISRFAYSKKNFTLDFRKFFGHLEFIDEFDKIGISLLRNIDKIFLQNFFKTKYDIIPVFINRNLNLPLKIKYEASLGNDRICSASAAVNLFSAKNILIIDFGTATTFTLVSDNVLTGGIIAPGIKTSLKSLTDGTTLPEVNLKFPAMLFNNKTAGNVSAGVLYQSLYFVERVIYEAGKNGRLFTIATGGFADLIARKTNIINAVDKHLVLKGINIIISK